MTDREIWDDPEIQDWLARANTELRPMITESAICMMLVPDDEPDAKMAIELGFMILLNKPIIALVVPGRVIPPKLAAVCDEIVVADLADPDAREKVQQAMQRHAGIVVEEPGES